MNSSLRTVLFVSISTKSMAIVGTSTRITRRSAFATEGSVPLKTNSQLSASKWRILFHITMTSNYWTDVHAESDEWSRKTPWTQAICWVKVMIISVMKEFSCLSTKITLRDQQNILTWLQGFVQNLHSTYLPAEGQTNCASYIEHQKLDWALRKLMASPPQTSSNANSVSKKCGTVASKVQAEARSLIRGARDCLNSIIRY